MRFIINPKPSMKVGNTKQKIYGQGITYNESGKTYNEVGLSYGGLYEHDIVPVVNWIKDYKPTIFMASDFGTVTQHGTVVLGSGMLIGILGNTYSESGTIIF